MLNFLTRLSLFGMFLLGSMYSYAQCTFTIQPGNPGANCFYGGETVVWTNLVNTIVSGTVISKNAGNNNNWNAGASSTSFVYNEGYIQSVVQETNRDRAFGLSTTDAGSGINGIDYAFLLQSNGNLSIYESGTNIGQFGTYSTSDMLKISVENSVVKYYQNGTLLYLSNTAPTLPLLVDISINDIGGTIADVEIFNGFDGSFTANLLNPGTGPTYDWYLNGVFATTGSTYTPPSLNSGDVVTANAFPGAGGCGTGPIVSNSITVSTRDISSFGKFDVIGTADPFACKMAAESAAFESIVNIFVTGNDLLKGQGGNNNWDAGATSLNTVNDNGYLEFTAGEDAYDKMIGLSNDAGGVSFNSIDYAIYMQNNDNIQIYENGASITSVGTYSAGDIFKVSVEEGVVKYYKNNVLLYISNDVPTFPLIVDVSMNDQGAAINDVTVVNGNTGEFTTISTNAGSNPGYQWQLNGVDLPGETASTYTNTSLVDGDFITCVITPDLAGCSGITYTSQPVVISEIATAKFGTFYVENTADPYACKEAAESATFGSIVNIFVTGNDLLKGQGGNNNWDAGATSLNTVNDNGYLEFTAGEDAYDKMIGLSNDAGGVSFNSIDYAIYMQNNDNIQIYENGASITSVGTYSAGDIFKVSVEEGVVKYYKNNVLLYISNDVPTFPLIVDVSMNDQGAAINDVTVVNGNTGEFTAISTNAGLNPGYQWQLNGVDLPGETASTYTNTSLVDGDVITCVIVPDLGGCSDVSYTSQPVTIGELLTAEFGTFYVENTADPYACKEAAESATFGSIVNIFVTGNDLLKGQGGNNNWDAGATSLNTVKDNGYLEFVAGEDAYDKMIGLSNDAGGVSFNSIDFAIYLQNDNDVRIYQNGADITGAGTYTAGDVFRIAVEDGVVKYYKNDILLYISNDVPTLPLLVDVSMNDQGAAINDVTVVNGNTGEFIAISTNAGSNPGYQWQLNGVDLPGETASTYTNTSLVDGDVITCVIVPDLGGCSDVSYTSLPVQINELSTATFGTFYVENTADPVACISAAESVTFENIVNVFVTGNDVLKGQGGNNNWNAGANSLNSVKNNGYLQFVAGEDAYDKMIGISNDTGNEGFNSIDYAFYLQNDDDIHVYENGSDQGNVGTYTTGDVFRIAVELGEVKFYQNGNLLYLSNTAPTFPLFVDLSLNDAGAALNDIVVVNGNTGNFTAISSNAGASPSYQWQINGVDVPGETNSSFTNTSLGEGDIVTCVIAPDLGGCSDVTYTSQPVEILEIPLALFGEFFITNVPTTNVQPVAFEEVTWSTTENVFVTGNDVIKAQGGNNNWNAEAFSANTVGNQAYAQTVITQTGQDRAFGLSNVNAGAGFAGIDYNFYLLQNGQLRIYENNSIRGVFGTYAIGDTLKVGVVDGDVVYYLNSTLLYTSAVAPVLPLHVDISINDLSGDLSEIFIVSLTEGEFTATTTNVGVSPQYQWKLNGADVGTNSPILSYPVLNDGDIFTVEIIPDIPGCSNINNPYVSNRVLINMYDPVLPVELLYFKTALTEIGTELTWGTSLEIDNDEFVLLKSSDGELFSEVARVKGQGNTNEQSDYRYHDLTSNAGKTYYRLDQIDFNGTRRTIALTHVIPDMTKTGYRVVNNPVVSKELKFIGDPSGLRRITVFTTEGRLMAEFTEPGENQIDVSHLPAGIYLVQFIQQNIITTNRVIIK